MVALVLALLANPAYAHKDSILTMAKDGTIADVPASFGKVRLQVDGLGTDAMRITLSIGPRTTVLPACMTANIKTKNSSDIRLAASWYHDQTNLPYYINVEFLDPGSNGKNYYNSSHSFSFSLNDARLLQSKKFIANKTGTGGRGGEITPPEGCYAVTSTSSAP